MALSGRRRTLAYAAYTAAVALALLYLLFPSPALRAAAARRIAEALPGAAVTIGSVRPALPLALELGGVAIASGGRELATIEQLRLSPGLSALFTASGRWRFRGALGGGTFTGEAQTAASGGGLAGLNARLEGARLERIPGLRELFGGRLFGTLAAEVSLGAPGEANARLAAADVRVELAQPLFDLRELGFRSVEAELGLQPRRLVVRSARLRGGELDAELTGTIALDPAAGKNALNLSGRATPQPALVARMEGSLPPNFLRRRGGLAFRVTGSFAEPGFSLN